MRWMIVAMMIAGIGVIFFLRSNNNGAVDLFTEDLAQAGIDVDPVNPGKTVRGGSADGPVEPNATVAAGPDSAAGDDRADIQGAAATDIPEALALTNGGSPSTGSPSNASTSSPSATRSDDTAGADANQNTITSGSTSRPSGNTTSATSDPPIYTVPGATTPTTADPGATTNPTINGPGSNSPTPPTAIPTVAAGGEWCEVEVRSSDGILRWNDAGRTSIFRRNGAWFHTPDPDAQAILIEERVDTSDDYILRLWGNGGTNDVLCTFASTTTASTEVVAPTATTAAPTTTTTSQAPTTTPPALAFTDIPAPIAIPGGPVQLGFNADLWGQDRTDYWTGIEAVPGNGTLIAHEFKTFTKSLNMDLYRWHLNSGRDLLLTWNGTDAESILNGSQDQLIRDHARQLQTLPGTVMLRFWHEPDVSHKLAWIDNDPQQFIDSWNYVRTVFAEEGAVDNIEWVWCPTAWNWEQQGARFYPGDANVDWICSDGYSGWDLNEPLPHIAEAYNAFQAWADQHPTKPILIAEFGAGERGPGERAEWVRGIPEWVNASPNIRAVVYFDFDRRPQGEAYDWRLRTEPDAWQAMMDVLSAAPFGR